MSREKWVLGCLCGIALACFVLPAFLALGPVQQQFWRDHAVLPLGAGASWLARRTSLSRDLEAPARRTWRRVAAAYTLWWLGDVVWYLLTAMRGSPPPSPSAATPLYVAHYFVLIWAILSFPALHLRRPERVQLWLDASTVVLGGVMAVWYVLLGMWGPSVVGPRVGLAAVATAIFFPVGDLVSLLALAAAWLHPVTRGRLALQLLGGTRLMSLAADTTFSAHLVTGASTTYDLYAGLNALEWLFAAAAAASYTAHETPRQEGSGSPNRTASLLPYASVVIGYSVLVLTVFQGRTGATRFLVVAAVLLTGVVVARQFLAVRENLALLGAHHREELSRSEERFFKIFNASPDAIAIMSMADGTVLEVNEALVLGTGYGREELLGHSPHALDLWQHREEAAMVTQLALSAESLRDFEVAFQTRRGPRTGLLSTDSIEIDGRPCVMAVVRDITRRKQAEEELRASEQKFAKAFHAGPDGLLLTRVSDGEILDANDSWARISGHRRRELIGRTPLQLGVWAEVGEWQRLCALAEANGHVRNHELALLTKLGEERNTVASSEVLRIGEDACLLTVIRDVTDSRRIEARFARQEHLKSEFVAMAAHELKTPVTVMKGYAQVLLASAGGDEAKDRMLAAIDRGADRISRVVQDLLDVARLQIGRFDLAFGRVDIAELVEQVASEMVQRSPAHRLRFAVNGASTLRGDRERLAQVFANLVGNAIKYSPTGGEVAVILGLRDGDVEVSVRDQGVGIPVELQAGIFERFYRAHAGTGDDFGGMGVGLFISQEIVARHGGRISFASEPGRGSTFIVRLPVEGDGGDGGHGG